MWSPRTKGRVFTRVPWVPTSCLPDDAGAIAGSAALQQINLHRNQIGGAGAVALAGGIEGSATLQEIQLTNNQIGDAGAVALAGAIEGSATLQEIDLGGNRIGDAGKAALYAAGAAKPNVTIEK